MSNINLNRNTPDPTDNNAFYTKNVTPDVIKHLTPLITYVGGLIGIVWIISMIANSIWCYSNKYDCINGIIVFAWYPLLLITGAIILFGYMIALAIQDYRNKAYLSYDEPRIHRDSIRANPNLAFDVSRENVKSKASAGWDTISPSISNSNTNKMDDKPAQQQDSLSHIPMIPLDEL